MSSPSASVVVATAQVVGVIPAGESEPEFAPTAPPRPPTPERGGDGNTGAGNNQSDAWNPFEVEVTLEASNGDADGNAAAAASAPGSPINFPVSAAAIPSATDSHMPSATPVRIRYGRAMLCTYLPHSHRFTLHPFVGDRCVAGKSVGRQWSYFCGHRPSGGYAAS
jgi:hypothetical protein